MSRLNQTLGRQASVALIGPCQAGKTTLARAIGARSIKNGPPRSILFLKLSGIARAYSHQTSSMMTFRTNWPDEATMPLAKHIYPANLYRFMDQLFLIRVNFGEAAKNK